MNENECCPKFDPTPWDGRLFEWNQKRFIKDTVTTFLHIPLNFGTVMRRLDEKVRNATATTTDQVCLSEHTSKWNMNVYLAVDKQVPDVENITLSGKFLSKVYEGPFQDTGKWCKDFEQFASSKGVQISKWYMWYTTCPKCAKKYGKNYVVIVASVT
ncbi:MAG: hypothetical protein BV459_07365 [Thermoplasmata archaeon M11B2D]|nr:MAG: hypothetical protein BV459_07365 [Thermoplasmata archaeon M11B2D]